MKTSKEADRDRNEILEQLENWLETPLLVLGVLWLVLLIVELAHGLNPLLESLGTAIWGIFLLDFGIKLILAPKKLAYIGSNWLTVLSLAVPALRVFRFARILRVARFGRGARLVKVIGSVNRGMKGLGSVLGRRGFGYVAALTLMVTLAGAAGMYALEKGERHGAGFPDYGTALWWTAMIMTTMGSEYWPKSGEARVLCLFLAMYAFAVFGYVTASVATFFIDQDKGRAQGEPEIREELSALHRKLDRLMQDQRYRKSS
jgi:voltage-gated potassium channel